MKLTVPSIDIDNETGFSPEIDIFNRKGFGESLLNLISNADSHLVLALDAPWGEGKSTFIKMWRGHLKERGVTSIYFDAFENDYQSDPFLAISSQIYSLVDDEDKHKEFREKANAALRVIGRASMRLGIRTLTAGILDETVFDSAGTLKDGAKEASDLIDGYIANRLEKANEDRESLNAFRSLLEGLGKELGGESPVIFVIDELDRCKPRFALEIIESIKHLFSVPNISFVLVMNRNQIEESVRCEYGANVEAYKYLQKFITVWATLPKSSPDYRKSIREIYVGNCLNRMGYPTHTNSHDQAKNLFEELVRYYDPSLREIEKCLSNFAIIQNTTDCRLEGYRQYMSVFLSILKARQPDVYRRLSDEKMGYDELVEEAGLNELTSDDGRDWPGNHWLKTLLKYCLGSDEEARTLTSEQHIHDPILQNKGCIKSLSKILDTFQMG